MILKNSPPTQSSSALLHYCITALLRVVARDTWSAPPSSLHPQGCHLAPLPPVAPVPCCRQALAPDLIRGLRRNLFLLEAVAFRVRKVSSTLPPWLKMSWGWWPGCLGRRRSRGGEIVRAQEFLGFCFFSQSWKKTESKI